MHAPLIDLSGGGTVMLPWSVGEAGRAASKRNCPIDPAPLGHDLAVSERRPNTRVLIVDDSPSFRLAARKLLERRGYTVAGEAGCCASALELASRLEPEAVLLDIQLPDGTGFAVAAALTGNERAPAVLLMTAVEGLGNDALVKQSGARGLVAKAQLAATDLARFWPSP
jgi:CheY-like chemotaxis protein